MCLGAQDAAISFDGCARIWRAFFSRRAENLEQTFYKRLPQPPGRSFMTKHVLITGGAGFIGSHLARELLNAGYTVRALDNLDPQVHPTGKRPDYLEKDVELVVGDVRNVDCVQKALVGIDMVCHLAAKVGVGQSMYEIVHYTQVNEIGTAVLLEQLAQTDIRKLLVASSISIYGEGLARHGETHIEPKPRSLEQLRAGQWELEGPGGVTLEPVPTPETKTISLHSIYALNKHVQEQMCLIWGQAYGREVTALRFFNAYGPHQALSNPYTGVLAIFASRFLNGRPPMIFEDGLQRRDFVHVRDVARACRLALESSSAAGHAINIASGEDRTILDVAHSLGRAMHRNDISPHVTGKYRAGDIRHCIANIARAQTLLGYSPQVRFEEGIAELVEWLSGQIAEDRVAQAIEELS